MVGSKQREIFETLKDEILGGKYASVCTFPSERALTARASTFIQTIDRERKKTR